MYTHDVKFCQRNANGFNQPISSCFKRQFLAFNTRNNDYLVLRSSRFKLDFSLRVGCEELSKMIFEENKFPHLKLHICGHIHEDRGIAVIGNKKFINASSVGLIPGFLKHLEVDLEIQS